MTFFKSAHSRFSYKQIPVIATNVFLDSWCHQLRTEPTQFVKRVELCTALAAGQDVWGTPVGKTHHHTLVRVLTHGGPGVSGDTFLIERVFLAGGSYHSVTPIEETLSTGGTPFQPEVHDCIYFVSNDPSTTLAHHLKVERTLTFGDGSSQLHLTLAQFAQIIYFVSQMAAVAYPGGDCGFQSRSFAFTCLAALTQGVSPTRKVVRKGGRCVHVNIKFVREGVDDLAFELRAEQFLRQVPQLVNDPASVQALGLIEALRDHRCNE